MIAGLGNKLPFGNLPRLLMAWVCSEAVRTQSRVLVLGKSLSEFMRALGVYDSSGRTQTRLRNQMKRLFGCTVSLIYKDENVNATVNAVIADHTVFWWNERKPDQPSLWDSKIELSEKFFNEIIRHPVPLNMNTLNALKRCSLGLDLYLWLVYRTFTLRAPLRLTWRLLYCQLGTDPDKASNKFIVRNFRTKCLRELQKIKLAWPGLNYSTGRGRLGSCIPQPRPSLRLDKPNSQASFPLSGLTAARQRPFRAGLDSRYPPRPGSSEDVNRWFATGLCESGEFSTSIRHHSPAHFFEHKASLPAPFFEHKASPYK